MATYNPFEDFNPAFTKYKYLEIPEIEDPLYGKMDISSQFDGISPDGTWIAKQNIPSETTTEKEEVFGKDIQDRMASTHAENPIEYSSSTMNQNLTKNKKQAMEFFQSKGLSAYHSAGIVGNLLGESNLNPEAVNPTSKAYGIAQWLGDRKKKLIAKYGNKPTFEQQLEFVWEELNSYEKSEYNKLLQTKNVDEAVNSFMKHFERPSQREMAQSITNRLKYGRGLLS